MGQAHTIKQTSIKSEDAAQQTESHDKKQDAQFFKLAKLKGEHFKLARKMANLTMEQLADKYHFGLSTIKMWENPKPHLTKKGLTKKGALKFVDAIYQEGILCDLSWLLGHSGFPPRFVIQEEKPKYLRSASNEMPEISLDKEIILFSQLNPQAITITLNDDGMAPYYSEGDTVGGIRSYENNIEKNVNKICIVELEDGRKLCRQLSKSQKLGYYNLHCINLMTTVEEPQQYNVKLISAAHIIRLWRREV